jgi:uncharacterized protein with FMN-binding domain
MKKKKVFLSFIFIVVVLFIIILFSINNMQKSLSKLDKLTIENINLSNAKDGTYNGSYGVFPVSAEVNVTIKNNKIVNIELLKHNNGKGESAEILTEKVVENQSLEVDIVSGATYSSKVILKSIENALNKSIN